MIEALRAIVGERHVLTDADLRAPFEIDWTRRFGGPALAVVRLASAAEVSRVLRACGEHGVAVVPQGANTGLVGGGVPRGGEIVVSLSRMRRRRGRSRAGPDRDRRGLHAGGPAAASGARRPRCRVCAACPGARTIVFGHLGDGNVHVNLLGPDRDDEPAGDAVLELVLACGATISAEHGVGTAKARWLAAARGSDEVAAMRAVKAALDPAGMLNPGVILTQAIAAGRRADRR